MTRLIISTIGTSILTNQIDRDLDPDWYNRLVETANYTLDEIEYNDDVKHIIQKLEQQANDLLNNNDDLDQIREASAELNGIYGIYDNKVEQGKDDIHLLITTDTAQGRASAKIIMSFLQDQGFTQVSITEPPENFSVASSKRFLEGIAKIIPSLEEHIKPCKDNGYVIVFNLVGGFKAFQGYFNTIGMFYADEIVYIFEGSNEIIKIPKLPIKVDQDMIAPHKVPLAMMDQIGIPSYCKEAKSIPKDWIRECNQEIHLSLWGQLVWNQCKANFLSNELLNFSNMVYEDSFKKDYEKIKNDQKQRIKLQEILAKVSAILIKSKGNVSPLKDDGGLQYDKYTNKGKIDHFRVTQGLRVSCISKNGQLILRHYGKEPVVNKNP